MKELTDELPDDMTPDEFRETVAFVCSPTFDFLCRTLLRREGAYIRRLLQLPARLPSPPVLHPAVPAAAGPAPRGSQHRTAGCLPSIALRAAEGGAGPCALAALPSAAAGAALAPGALDGRPHGSCRLRRAWSDGASRPASMGLAPSAALIFAVFPLTRPVLPFRPVAGAVHPLRFASPVPWRVPTRADRHGGALVDSSRRVVNIPDDPAIRQLVSTGGPHAERTLADWRDESALEPLVALCRDAADEKSRVLATRGAIRIVQQSGIAKDERMTWLQKISEAAPRATERQQALAALEQLKSGKKKR